MKQIRIDHTVNLSSSIKDLLVVNLDQQSTSRELTPQVALDGTLYLSGKYRDESHQTYSFEEEVPFHYTYPIQEVTHPSVIEVRITDFDYSIDSNQIHFVIHLEIPGIEASTSTFLATSAESAQAPKDAEIIDFREPGDIEPPKEPLEVDLQGPLIKEISEKEDLPSPQSKNNKIPAITNNTDALHLFRNTDRNQVVWSFRVILKGDSLKSICDELHIMEQELLDLNPSLQWIEGQLMHIPAPPEPR